MPAPAASPPSAPAAPAAGTPAPASVGSAVPPSTGVINVGQPSNSPTTEPAKPGSPRAGMFERLNKLGKPHSGAVEPAEPKPAAAKAPVAEPKEDEGDPDDAPEDSGVADDVDPESAPSAEEKAAAAAAPKIDGRKTKANPWHLLRDEKATTGKLQQEVAELRKLVADPAARKSEVERLAKIEARNKELEDHITFTDYSKSKDFVEKYQQPYEQQWTRSMAELKEIVITDPDSGAERNMSPKDLLELVNMPLNKARERAEQLYGSSANDVMDHRREVRKLYDAQASALEKAKKDGAEHFKTQQAQTQAQMAEAQKLVGEAWNKTNNDIIADPKIGHYFKPIEGDADANTRLEKGYKFVDEAFAENPMDPKLNAEQRAAVVKKHAAVRHRAAAFGRMRYLLEKTIAREAALTKKLAEFEGTVPEFGGRQPQNGSQPPANARQGMFDRLRAAAKPG